MMTQQEILEEIGGILDRLSTLPRYDIAQRSALHRRHEELRALLDAAQSEGAKEIKARWDERAAGKPKDNPRPVIVSPIESGGGGVA
jgi:hypothetical protein